MKTTLDAWEVLHAVVHGGGFAAAARQLHRSQSTISYAISRLQEQLGVRLFEMKGRQAQLTEAGRILLAGAEPHLLGFRQLEQSAASLSAGGRLEVRLSVDSLFPPQRLFSALALFSRRFPYAHPKLRQSAFIAADSEFSVHQAQLCITGLISSEYFVQPVLDIRLIAVARRGHPLLASQRPLTRLDLIQHTLVVVEGPGGARRQPRAPAQRLVTVGSIGAAVDAVRSGFGFGWLPAYRIAPELKRKTLRPLRLAAGGIRLARLNLVCRDLHSGGRELPALAELLGLNRDLETI